MEEGRQVYLFMLEKGYRHIYTLYRIGEPPTTDSSGEASVSLFDAPLVTMDKPTYPQLSPAFTAIGSRIFIIGGYFDDGCSSNKVFIYDTSSSTLVPGPDMNSGKLYPYLFTFGSKIFALSRHMYASETGSPIMESNPRFEMLDTSDEDPKWTPLPNPVIHGSSYNNLYTLCAGAGVVVNGCTPVIFVSVKDAGIYVFEVDNLVWYYIGTEELLPTSEVLVTIPYAPFMCFGRSLKSKRLAAFHFHYEGNGKGFKVNEVRVDGYENLPSLGGPPLLLESRSLPVVFGPDNRVYFIYSGVDKAETWCSPPGNRYVKVYALDFEGINLDYLIQKQFGRDEDQDETITKVKLSTEWRECFSGGWAVDEIYESVDEINEDQDEITKVNKLSRKWGECFSGGRAVDEIYEAVDETITKVKLSSKWGECFFGGQAIRDTLNVLGAIAM